jgi:hypothetical protein
MAYHAWASTGHVVGFSSVQHLRMYGLDEACKPYMWNSIGSRWMLRGCMCGGLCFFDAAA